MKNYFLFSFLLFLGIIQNLTGSPNDLKIESILCENRQETMGVATSDFSFSWKIFSNNRNIMQSAYRICLADLQENLSDEQALIWDSGIIKSQQSNLVTYEGSILAPGTTYHFKVKVWDNHGNESPWSDTGKFTTGLFDGQDWEGAKWIAYDELPHGERVVPGIHGPAGKNNWKDKDLGNHKLPIFRQEFEIRKDLKQALVFVSGLGHYELLFNGHKIGDRFLSPGWTDYDAYCFYNTYDITHDVISGKNAVGIMLGNGFYIIPNNGYRKLITAFGNPKLLIKIKLIYKDGTSKTVVSDETWKTSAGPITYSSIFAGETYDAQLEQNGWDLPDFNDSQWRDVLVVKPPSQRLLAEMDHPLKICEEITIKTIRQINRDENVVLYDFGQNASGIVELTVQGSKGDTVRMVPAELLSENGEAEQRASGKPFYFTYILKGEGVEVWRPRFTYYGFRYIQVEGAVHDSEMEQIDAPKIHSLKLLHTRNSAPEQGTFTTSYDLFNQINHLIKWAIRSNFQSVVTDCPHREKLGWLEQTYLMGEAIHYNYDIYHLYKKQIDDMIIAQTEEGLVPDIAPEYTEFQGGFRDSPEWGSAAVILPWLVYKWYGDSEPIKKAWDMMARYVEYLRTKSENHILSHGLGDWYDLGPKHPGPAQLTPKALTATAIYYYDVYLLSKMADVLDKQLDKKYFSEWADEIKDSFNNKFLNPKTSVYSTGSQTAIAMPLVLNLVPEEIESRVEETLIESIHRSGKALTAGDVGFHFLVRALYEMGADELLYEMNARDDVPGYGYQLKKGATALTESWAALTNVSNNHLMLGHLMEWFYAGLAGIGQMDKSIAYKEVLITPRIIKEIESAEAQFESPYGRITSHWKKRDGGVVVNIEIPANSKARISLPITPSQHVYESGKLVDNSEDIHILERLYNSINLKLGSGNYKLVIR